MSKNYLNVIKLNWCNNSNKDDLWSSNSYNDGLWCNNGKIALHLPLLKKNNKNLLNYSHFEIIDKLYINYNENDCIEKIQFYYYTINDIVLKNKTWKGLKKANIYIREN